MRTGRMLTVLVSLLMLLGICSAAAQHLQAKPHTTSTPAFPRIGHSFAFSDFDQDGLLDRASVEGSGSHKTIKVLLSSSGRHSRLSLETGCGLGSLYAHDLNHDGDADLIWSDALHPSEAVAWIGDGSGSFERANGNGALDEFAVGGCSASKADESDDDSAIADPSNGSADQLVTRPAAHHFNNLTILHEHFSFFVSSFAAQRPVNRGPPLLS